MSYSKQLNAKVSIADYHADFRYEFRDVCSGKLVFHSHHYSRLIRAIMSPKGPLGPEFKYWRRRTFAWV
jgi:hypothetical protein